MRAVTDDGSRARRYAIAMEGLAPDTDNGTLAQRIAAAPQLHAAEAARARVEDWLAEIAETSAGKALRGLLGDHAALAALITGLADGSPYLWELARRSP